MRRCSSFLRLTPDSKVLLPGCGSATDVSWLLSAGMQVDAIDFSHEAVKRARQALQAVRCVAGDFTLQATQAMTPFSSAPSCVPCRQAMGELYP
jgi:cyclopropane fatty-acyl-phospholipid synthase-like methyltransferase